VVSFDPVVFALLALAGGLYIRAVRRLGARGYDVPRGQQVCWWIGFALITFGLVGPADAYADDLMLSHMAQHLLIADLAAPLLLAGLRTPVLVHYLPRPVLVPLARRKGFRALLRKLRRPLPAVAIYVGVLYFWHLSFAFVGALEHGWVHVLQHQSFIIASLLLWWPVIEPKRRRMRGDLWKAPHIMGSRLAGMFLGMAFVIAGSPVYGSFYGDRGEQYGISALRDQQYAGGMMMGLDLIIMFSVLVFFFFRSAQDHDRAEAAERAAAGVG
jgi:cytochrome c oxidase assembly factor CtaG